MMGVLVSGINGFVGSNLSSYLLEKNYTVTGISRFAGINQKNRSDPSWNDLSKIRDMSLTAIVHLAGKAHDLKKVSQPGEYFEINTGLTQKLFDIFLKSKARDFIYFSSVKAVADSVEGILFESVKPDPKSPYGLSKLKAEEYLVAQNLPEGKRLFILRPCMIHGAGNKGNLNLLYSFVKKGIPYPLAAFENQRSLLSMDNLSYIVYRILEDTTISSGIYNVTDSECISTNDMIRIISEAAGKKQRLIAIPKPFLKGIALIGDKIRLPLNSERLKKLTENYIVSNDKILKALKIDRLPLTAQEGLRKTILSFKDE